MGQQAPGICLCLFLPLLSLPSWGHAAVDPSVFLKPLPHLPAVYRAQEGSCIVRSVFLAALARITIFSTQQRAGQLGHAQWEGGHWLLTVMLLCQPKQVGLASSGINYSSKFCISQLELHQGSDAHHSGEFIFPAQDLKSSDTIMLQV